MDISLVVTGGEAPLMAPPFKYKTIIAADSGYDNALLLSLLPDVAVGDFDSTHYKDILVKEGFKPLPRDKDWSDTEVAINLLEGKEYDLLGGGGGRVDHLMAILALFEHYRAPRYWFLRSDILIRVEHKITLNLGKDVSISVLPMSGRCAKVKSKGLLWPLDGLTISSGFVSLSNRSSEEVVEIEGSDSFFVRLESEYALLLSTCITTI